MKNIRSFDQFVNESLNEASRWKGSVIYPDWVKPTDIGAFVKSIDELKVGNLYVIKDHGDNAWHAEYKYTGKNGAMHQFVSDAQYDNSMDWEFTDQDLEDTLDHMDIANMK